MTARWLNPLKSFPYPPQGKEKLHVIFQQFFFYRARFVIADDFCFWNLPDVFWFPLISLFDY